MTTRIRIGASTDFPADTLIVVRADNTPLVVARLDGTVRAASYRCPHLGLPMGNGTLTGTTITCPWHGSQFDMCSGANLDWVRAVAGIELPQWSRRLVSLGRQPTPLPIYPVVEEAGEVFVEL